MRKATSILLRFVGVPERTESLDWWTYFGSFGNDIFGDEDTADVLHQQAAWGAPAQVRLD